LIQPPPGSKPGDRVYFEGPEYESRLFRFWNSFCHLLIPVVDAQPLSQLNPKKKIFESIQPGKTTIGSISPITPSFVGFTTLETREAAWVNPVTRSAHRIRTKDGVCLAPTFVGASLS